MARNKTSKNKRGIQKKTKKNGTRSKRQTETYNHDGHKHVKISDEMYKNAKCAPKDDKQLDFTCYTTDSLYKMRNLWNSRHPDCKIENDTPRKIWEKLRDYIGETCNIESCWLKQHFIKNNLNSELLNYTFAPKSPEEWKKNPDEWLSSLDILAVMKQYEHKYKCFNFIGPSPIDYDTHFSDGECVWEELCEFSLLEHIKNNTYKIGIIFNLDPHYLNGSHWVSMFINCKNGKIIYFDSYGENSEPQIKKLMKNIKSQGKDIGIDFEIIENNKRHQYSDSECGMYSLYFIIEMLKDSNPEKFLKHRIDDKKVKALRKEYFN